MTVLRLPGHTMIAKGVADLRDQRVTIEALLVSMAPGALRDVGLAIPAPLVEPESRLFALLDDDRGLGAHSLYNAYRRLLASYLRAARCAGMSIKSA